jgi:hypothetical protein
MPTMSTVMRVGTRIIGQTGTDLVLKDTTMLLVHITRYLSESDPLQVIGDAWVQATVQRQARRLGLATEHKGVADCILHVTACG